MCTSEVSEEEVGAHIFSAWDWEENNPYELRALWVNEKICIVMCWII